MYGSKRVAVRDLNPHILCALCGGYLIQATTVIECLHSFCRSCIVNFLETSKVCPICDAQIHKTRPLLNIRPDQTLQSLVYKLVPGLFQDEMRRRREFHSTLSESDVEDLTLEERGEASLEKEFKPGDDHVSVVLQLAFRKDKGKHFEVKDRRYLLCPSEVTVRHLKKFIRLKFQLTDNHQIEMFRAKEELTDDLMLQDIALIYSWRGEKPMHLCYTITESTKTDTKCSTKVQHSMTSTCKEPPPLSQSTTVTNTTITTSESHVNKPSPAVTTLATRAEPTPPQVSSIYSSTCSTSVAPSTAICLPPPSSCNITDAVSSSVKRTPGAASESCRPSVSIKKGISPPSLTAISLEQKVQPSSTAIVSPMVASASYTSSKSTPVVSKQDASKLMHSVQSILNKSPKKTQSRHSPSSISWTPVSDVKPKFPDTTSKINIEPLSTNSYKNSSAFPTYNNKSETVTKCETISCDTSNPSHAKDSTGADSKGHLVTAIKRSQSAIETSGAVIENKDHTHKSSEIVNPDHAKVDSGQTEPEDTEDVFSSYIPKFQKHRQLCAVKRSVSYEETPLTPTVLSPSSCGDAMEKRNWKKRKLSTLDFEAAKIDSVDGNKDTAKTTQVISSHVNHDEKKSQGSHHQATKNGNSSASKTNSNPSNSLVYSSSSSTSRSITPSVSYLPFLPPPSGKANTLSLTKSSSHGPKFDQKVKPCEINQTSTANHKNNKNSKNDSSKNLSSSSITTTTTNNNNNKNNDNSSNKNNCITNNNNALSCQSKYNDTEIVKDSPKHNTVSSKKQRCLSGSSQESPSIQNKKSSGCLINSSNKSENNKCANSSFAHGCSNSKSVEEISVEISSSPSDVSTATSPATDVTSPGTEDRLDNSALPEIQTSCDNSCVVSFPGKVVPLDLSNRKKK